MRAGTHRQVIAQFSGGFLWGQPSGPLVVVSQGSWSTMLVIVSAAVKFTVHMVMVMFMVMVLVMVSHNQNYGQC